MNKMRLWKVGVRRMWETLNVIFTAGGIVTVLFGGSLLGLIVWITRKPRVIALSKPSANWFYTFRDGTYYSNINIEVFIELTNKGKEKTTIGASFQNTKDACFAFHTSKDDEVELKNNESVSQLFLQAPYSNTYQEGYAFDGVLRIEPSGNRRLLLFGRKYLTFKCAVSEDQGKRYDYGNRIG